MPTFIVYRFEGMEKRFVFLYIYICTTIFHSSMYSREITDVFSDTAEGRCFKLCMIITLLRV